MDPNDKNSSLDDLKHFIQTCPVIDHHGQNLLRHHGLKTGNLSTITTHASEPALDDTPSTLSHLRAAKQLTHLFDLPSDSDWPSILGKRAEQLERDSHSSIKKCLRDTQTILLDDGNDSPDVVEPYTWHSQFTLSPCKRILCIETLATSILASLNQHGKLPVGVAIADEEACSLAWVAFVTQFEQAIAAAVEDAEVVGFKSVVCCRTGLDIEVRRDIDVSEDGLRSFRRHYLPECLAHNFKVECKGMNDALVISTCKLIAAGFERDGVAKPLQFYSGLGDSKSSLLDANPGCLQDLMKAFPSVPMVLLNASYPYTLEAGHLATVYPNVFLDLGKVFPAVSRDGQQQVLRQAMELAPTSKLLWSSGGHHFPESYWLANLQGRAAMERVMCEYAQAGDLTAPQALQMVRDILFQTSNKLYRLGLKLDQPRSTTERPRANADEVGLDVPPD